MKKTFERRLCLRAGGDPCRHRLPDPAAVLVLRRIHLPGGVHAHLFGMGMLLFLILLALEKALRLTCDHAFRAFFSSFTMWGSPAR